jgi:YidC/Oxa1 family membrane protein insertase
MTNEKRFVLFVTIVFLWMMATNYFFPRRKPAPVPPAVEKIKAKDKLPELDLAKADVRAPAKEETKPAPEKSKDPIKNEARAAVAAAPPKPEIELVKPTELLLGSATDKSVGGYRIEAQLEQKGAGIYSVYSSRYDAEPEDNGLRGMARKRPLRLIDHNRHWPPSLALTAWSAKPGTTWPSGRPPSKPRIRWIRYFGTLFAMRMGGPCGASVASTRLPRHQSLVRPWSSRPRPVTV